VKIKYLDSSLYNRFRVRNWTEISSNISMKKYSSLGNVPSCDCIGEVDV
jgi:hypothetical protein